MIGGVGVAVRGTGGGWRVSLVVALLLALVLTALGPPTPVGAAMITVTSDADAGGTCPGVGCTLRQAIAVANNGDTIDFAPAVTEVTLESGELAISKTLTIQGGASGVEITRLASENTPQFRLLSVNGAVTVTLEALTLSNGNPVDGAQGGGIRNQGGTLRLIGSTVTGNNVGGGGQGAGIYQSGGSLELTNSTISGNDAAGLGGGLHLAGGTATLTESIVSGNGADGSGGLHIASGAAATLTRSTFNGNVVRFAPGGGIYVAGGLTATNSTISGNTSYGDDGGGGVYVAGGTATLTHVTIVGNTAYDTTGDGVEVVGGGALTLTNSILTSNPFGIFAGCADGFTSGGHNVVGTGCATSLVSTDLAYTGTLDTLLNPTLADNGATTPTHALVLRSPAIDLVPTSACTGIATDQRGRPRPRGPACDAGAYEYAYRTLTVALAGDGAGQVQRAPSEGGSGPGAYPYPAGTIVSLAAVPGSGSRFVGWTVGGTPQPSPLTITLTDDTTVTATFALNPTLTVQTVGNGGVARDPAGEALAGGAFAYAPGTAVALTPQPAPGQTFVGWTVDGVNQGWPNPLTITVDASHTIIATFKPTSAFPDVGSGRQDFVAIRELASRGTIRGYVDGRYGPEDKVRRDQMAALIARAMPAAPGTAPTNGTLAPPACLVSATWDCEDWGNNFKDRGVADANLWRNIGTLQHYGVSLGYAGATCTAKKVPSPCYGPGDNVTYAQTISFITRAMKAKGYWVDQPAAPLPYQNVPAAHQLDVRTFHYYTQGLGGIPAPPANWDGPATRGWFARALWAALDSYWKTDRVP